jgi:myo-inositol-1(or 4)-monophosphatase
MASVDRDGNKPMSDQLLVALNRAVDAVVDVLSRQEDWSLTGLGHNQYHHDTVADAAAIEVLDAAGLAIFSGESGVHNPDRPVMVVIDPVDGSTNASRGLPWWAVSLCVLDGFVVCSADSLAPWD